MRRCQGGSLLLCLGGAARPDFLALTLFPVNVYKIEFTNKKYQSISITPCQLSFFFSTIDTNYRQSPLSPILHHYRQYQPSTEPLLPMFTDAVFCLGLLSGVPVSGPRDFT